MNFLYYRMIVGICHCEVLFYHICIFNFPQENQHSTALPVTLNMFNYTYTKERKYRMSRFLNGQKKNLSLFEILCIIFIFTVVAGVVVTAVNPNDRRADARDAKRIVDMHSLITAIHQYIVDTNGTYPDGVTVGMSETQLGSCTSGGASFCAGAQDFCIDISSSVVPYIGSVPRDPLLQSDQDLQFYGYSIRVSEDGVVTVRSCGAETSTLEVSR